jgi:hypothetical protein
LVYVVQKTSWLDGVSGEYFVYYLAIFLTGILFQCNIRQKISAFRKDDVDWKIPGFLLIFTIILLFAGLGMAKCLQQASTGNPFLLVIGVIAFILGMGLYWLYHQYEKPDEMNLVRDMIMFESIAGCTGAGLGFFITDFAGKEIHQSDLFTWFAIGGLIVGGFIAVVDRDDDAEE